MRYFIDTEFCERGPKHPIELISIGVVSEDGREFYACNQDFTPKHASLWIRENVLPHLPPKPHYAFPYLSRSWMPYKRIRSEMLEFIGDDIEPEFWGYYCAFDYVVLSHLMGGMAGWPQGWPYYMRDVRQWLDEHGYADVSQLDDAPHNALEDARWIAGVHRGVIQATSTTSWGGPLNRVAATFTVPRDSAA